MFNYMKNYNDNFVKEIEKCFTFNIKSLSYCFFTITLFAIFSLFVVKETETTFIVRFGKVIRQINKAGIYVKTPLIDNTVTFDKRILQVYSPAKEVIASDQKRLIVDAYAKYKIVDTKKFYENMRNEQGANIRVSSMLDSIMRQVVATNPLSSFLTTQRSQMMENIQTLLAEQTKEFGINIIDVRIIRADLPIENSEAIFKRMKTEREKEAQELRSQGKQEATIIMASANKEAKEIRSVAQREASKIMGKADAEVIKIHSRAFSKDPKFYEFYKTLEIYKNTLPKQKIIISTKDNDFLQRIKKDQFSN